MPGHARRGTAAHPGTARRAYRPKLLPSSHSGLWFKTAPSAHPVPGPASFRADLGYVRPSYASTPRAAVETQRLASERRRRFDAAAAPPAFARDHATLDPALIALDAIPSPPPSPPPSRRAAAPPRSDLLTHEQAAHLHAELLAGDDQPADLPEEARSLCLLDSGKPSGSCRVHNTEH